ncbi:hypothetical protein ACFL2V_21835 [Pseudomonadota bacterium]
MKRIIQLIYHSEPFEMSFDLPLKKAVDRLHSKVGRTAFSCLLSQGMVGSVSEEKVHVQRVIPMVQNSFKPVFVGSFRQEGDKTVLSGVLRFSRFNQVSMSIWFGFIILWILISLVFVALKPADAWFFPLGGILMFALGVGLVKVCKWFSRNDKDWLYENIGRAINTHNN